ncbi:hypothetical protein F9Z45_00090 [Hydrogenophaga sp. PBL-H3]|nr:hypothetical protein F9Z45_00090 [Hydrogenophaga sp. PBL-H3]
MTEAVAEPAPPWAIRLARMVRSAVEFSLDATREEPSYLWPPLRLEKLLLLMDVVRHIVLPKYLKNPSSMQVWELSSEILRDPSYQQHLWEHIFLHASASPLSLSAALVPGKNAAEMASTFAPIAAFIQMPRILWRRSSQIDARDRRAVFYPSSNLIQYAQFSKSLDEEVLDDVSPNTEVAALSAEMTANA